MRTVLDGEVWVHYGQIYVQSDVDFPGLGECFGGQENGLCGAAIPGYLFLITGLHTGEVGFTVEVHDGPPPLDGTWEDVVEVSFRPDGDTSLVTWGGEGAWPLDLADDTDHRVRYCGTRMDEARAVDCRTDDEPQVDRYLLQFWPAPAEPDRILRSSSEIASYWHEYAAQQPPPPTAQERAEEERLALLEKEREAREARVRAEEREWGGRLPSDRLRQVRGSALSLAQWDRPLVDTLAEIDADTQRAVARWATRRACTEAGLVDVDWIAPALAAMDQGEPLPPPLDGDLPWDLLLSDPQVPRRLMTSLDGRHDNVRQQAMALPALLSAREEDPLRAALDALRAGAACFGQERWPVFFAEVRQAFPTLGTPTA